MITIGDRVTITNPIQPTRHTAGETGVVIDTWTGDHHEELAQIQEDATGELSVCYATELTKN